MHPDLQAFARTHHLPVAVARDLDALVARMLARPLPIDAERVPPAADPNGTASGSIPARYEDLGRIGKGGMGEVRRVRDRELGRTCAYKVIRARLADQPNLLGRFVDEAQIGAQLQHPNIPPVYDGGLLPDGRPWFTMMEVRGRTFGQLIREAHQDGITDAALRRLCDVLASVCDAVGYAHGRGVVHRDLKPDNVMVGSHGEVFVVDWGLGKVVGRPERPLDEAELEPEVATGRSADSAARTRVGGVLGTAAYMPPEQARGEVDRLDARADVYALGALLYELLSGRPPYKGQDARAVLMQVLAGPPEPPGAMTGLEDDATFDTLLTDVPHEEEPGSALPEELVSLCLRCLERDAADRPADGGVVGAALRGWLEGAGQRAKALEVVAQAQAAVVEAEALRERAAALRAQGEALLAPCSPWAPEEEKAPGWAKQDEAERVERRAAALELRRDALLRGALMHAPTLAEAHAALVDVERSRHAEAEAARDHGRAARVEARLREHTEALREDHPTRVDAMAYLKGDGALSLVTDPPGADVLLYRYERRNRRLVEVRARSLGRTPLVATPLPMGSYLCLLRHPERGEVRYPVHIGRGEHWDGVAPEAREPLPVRLPGVGELGPEDCLVPAGWFRSGGDPDALDSLPAQRRWCDELIVRRFPVTNREYLAFLDALVASGREAEALHHQPRVRSAGEGTPVYGRDGAGGFVLRPDADGDLWDPEWPVFVVDWFGATAYAAWLAETTGRPWRLLDELEWEKAARGVDGRHYPWGDFLDPSWACTRASHPGRQLPQRVDSFPVDASPYGVRGLAGNVQTWCADVGLGRPGPPPGDPASASTPRSIRGAFWLGTSRGTRSASRGRVEPGLRLEGLGLRVAYRP